VGAIGGLTPSAQATLAGGLLLALVAVGCAGAFASLTRAHGRVLVRLDRLEEELSAAGLRLAPETPLFELGLDPGTRAPEFVAETVRGDAVALGDLLAPGLPLVLVFTSPHCGPCTALMPRLSAWQAEHAATLTFAIASSGGREEIRAEAGDLGWALLDTDLALSGAFQAAGTPSAVLVAVDGTIASYVAAGADEIEQLVLAALAPDGSTWSEDRLSIGAPIPELTLFDLGGVPVDLVDPLGRTTLVLFWNPSCGFCGSARDDLLDWERRATTDTPRLVVVSSGDEDSTRADGFSSTVVLDESFAVGDAFGADGTPMAVLVDSSGRIASHLAAGRDAVLELATRISGGDQAAAAANGAGR
jgi:thiol-disulfide isomerase/thioredoxin